MKKSEKQHISNRKALKKHYRYMATEEELKRGDPHFTAEDIKRCGKHNPHDLYTDKQKGD